VIKNNFKKLKNITLLSPKQFTMTRIPVIIVETSNHNDHLQLVDATDFSKKEGKIMTMTDEHVKETCKRINGEIVDHLTHKLDEQEAKENNYNLNITRYIQREIEEEIDIEQLAIEIDENITEILNFFSDNDRHENVNIFKKNAKEMKNIFG
jgi:type I restriction-modification system DNA methylase subunit